jgi:hypothetical protein
MAAAVSVYVTMRLLAPPRQIFVEYNVLLNPLRPEDLRRMVRSLLMFLTWGAIPLLALAVAAIAASLQPRQEGGTSSQSLPWLAMSGAVFLCCAAAFPYVMVGKGPPIFTVIGLGNSVTEQVLASAHSGPLAPTWANTSGRHGFLFAVPVAFLTWFLVRALLQRLGAGRRGLSAGAVFLIVLPVFLFWVIPAYQNKLETQYTEISLTKGLKALPAPPAGVVSLHYVPATDWAIWSVNANLMMREAWGRSDYFGMFYAVDGYRDDLLWQYHAYVRAQGGLRSNLLQHMVAMHDFPGEDCVSRYDAKLPAVGWVSAWRSGLQPDSVPAAQVTAVDSSCKPGNMLPNPTPDKKIIP